MRELRVAKPGLKASSYEELLAQFKNPPADFRAMPLWVWNDELDWPRLKQALHQMKAQGLGGVFVHPRPGLMTEYLGPEWFKLWQQSVQEGRRLGLFVNIYDENSYPAGFAGGHVPARAPDTIAQYVELLPIEPVEVRTMQNQSQWNAGYTVAAFELDRGADGKVSVARRIRQPAEASGQKPLALFNLRRATGNAWTAGFPYVDLTNPETAPAFLATTYEAYRRAMGREFGKTVRWSFQDEPLLATTGPRNPRVISLPLSYNTLAEFQKRCGYDLRDELISLFYDVGDWKKVRFDYWQTLHDLWLENFIVPISAWCDRHALQYTGHFMEHEWPYPRSSPDDMSIMAFEHMPGIDMLEGTALRTSGEDPHMLFTIREVSSVAHQTGRRAFCEAFAVAGWDATLEHLKRFGDWLMVNGINFITQHGVFTTVRGARKRDHPQSFSDHAAWWPYYRVHADEMARVCFALWQGEAENRVLLLQPTTSGFLWGRRVGETPELDALRSSNASLNQFLADHQVDFDLGDEYLMEWLGDVKGTQLLIGKAAYELVVWPSGMATVRHQTVPLLEKYLAAGGEILALQNAPVLVDGRASDRIEQLRVRYSAQWHVVSGLPELLKEIGRRLPPRVKSQEDVPPSIGHQMRRLPNGDTLHFFANTGLKAVSLRASVAGQGLEEWNPSTGEITTPSFSGGGSGQIQFDIALPPTASRLYYVGANVSLRRLRSDEPRLPAPRVVGAPAGKLPVGDWTVTPSGPNLLVLDYCDLEVAGQRFTNLNTWQANWNLWQAHGFQRPVWDDGVQFRRRVIDRTNFPADSGFVATFRFTVADAQAIPGMQLAIESPELYRVSVNGRPVDFAKGRRWLDPHMKSVGIGALVQVGENTVRLEGRPFNVRMELENIYLRGNFAAVSAAQGFRLAAAGPLTFGSWLKQGYPFFSDSVTYETAVEFPSGAECVRITLPEWSGSVAEVLLDGRRAGVSAWPPYELDVRVMSGRHSVAVKVVATPRNTFGPFHNPDKPRMRAWPALWARFPEHQPAGDKYDLLDYGLMSPFEIRAMADKTTTASTPGASAVAASKAIAK